MRPLLLLLTVSSVLALAACGSDSSSAPADERLTAAQVVDALAERIPQAKPSIVYDEESDPNDLLGRPNGYESKAAFTDSRVPKSKAEGIEKGDVELGGGVEVFANAERAGRRAEYLDEIQAAGPELLGSDYLYEGGPVLLRVSGLLTPKEAKEYEVALGEILDAPVSQANKGGG